MARKKAGSSESVSESAASGKKKRYVFSREAEEETDPEWRQWFLHVMERRKELRDPKRRPVVFSRMEKERGEETIIRRQSEPLKLSSVIKHDAKKTGRNLDINLAMIESVWEKAVGKEFADETRVFSFKNGVLTVAVFSSTLLQEIRQFHQDAILEVLRDIWSVPMPLVAVVYRMGKKR